MSMHATRSLPFVFSQFTNNVETNNYVYTRDSIQGLLRLENMNLYVQWRLTRKVDRYGKVTSSDSEQYPVREHAIPVSKLTEVRIRRLLFHFPLRKSLIIVSSDLQAFDPLTGEGDLPGLMLNHPAELSVMIRRQDQQLAEDFASNLRAVISEYMLDSLQQESNRLSSGGKKQLPPGD